jgi:hypothetical protein
MCLCLKPTALYALGAWGASTLTESISMWARRWGLGVEES